MSQLRRVNTPNLDKRADSKHRPGIEKLKSHGGLHILTTQSFDVGVDTGSSVTWLVTDGYTCAAGPCLFGPSFTPEDSATQVNDIQLDTKYASGEYVKGNFVRNSVTIAGVTIPQQEIGTATLAGWNGDGTSSGIVGLGCAHRDQESSLINTMFSNDNITPKFAPAISRDESGTGDGGWLAIGGTPKDLNFPNINVTSKYTSAPFEFYKGSGSFYAITVGSLSYGSASSSEIDDTSHQFIIDSNSPFSHFPDEAAAAINPLFDPPATKDASGNWLVECSATAPQLSLNIGGLDFPQNPYDLIRGFGTGCASSIQASSGDGYQILGDQFLPNVLAVFDWGVGEMKIASRPYYQS